MIFREEQMSKNKTEVTLIKSQGKVENSRVERNIIEGYDSVTFVDTIGDIKDSIIADNKIVSLEAIELLQNLQKEADQLDLTKSQRTDLNRYINSMESTIGSVDFTHTYKEFTNFLSAHMTIMMPLLPIITQLGLYLS